MKNLKKYFKYRINSAKNINMQEITKKTETYKFISFDIFDTLIKRNVANPEDIFDILILKYKNIYGLNIDNFKKRRIEAECIARRKNINDEITLKEIYDNFYGITINEKNILMDLENSLEIELSYPNLEIIDFYNRCIKEKEGVFLISDMYLSEETIRKILKKCGIEGYDKLYVSSTYKKTKISGELFNLVLKDKNIESKQLIHIGDSLNADVRGAKKNKIHSYKVPTYINRTRRDYHKFVGKNNCEFKYLNSFINNSIDSNWNEYYKFGYEAFGMALWGFSRWLQKQIKKEKINKVYFFSRDGYIMKKAFDKLNEDESIKTYYLEVSRRSLRVPILWMDMELSTVLDMISPSSMVSIKSIFDGVGLDINQYEDNIKRYGFNKNSKFIRNTILKNEKLVSFYEELKPDIYKNSKMEYKNISKYLEKNKLFGKIAIVDIGWSGGMQRYLIQCMDKLNIDVDITGYYTGIAKYVTRNTDVIPMDLKGYFFDFNNNPNDIDLRSSFVGLYESLFLEQKGSVKRYVQNEDCIIAERYDYEYLINNEIASEAINISKLQDGALKFIDNIKDLTYFNLFNLESRILFNNIFITGVYPNSNDLEMFSGIRFFDEGEIEYLAEPKKISRYIIHPRIFIDDFFACRWKIGFMKNLFRVNLPYKNIYDILIKFK